MSGNNDIKNLDESNAKCDSIFNETELTIINDENTEVKKIVKTSPFEGLTIDEITFSSMDNEKPKAETIKENVDDIRKFEKLNKGKKIINNRGIDYFSMTLEFSNVVEVAGSKTVQVNISPRYMKSAIEFLGDSLNSNPVDNNLLIVDTNGENLDVSLFSCIYDKINRLGVVTNNLKRAEMFEEKLMDNYGLYPEIINGLREERDFTYIVDMDKCMVEKGINSYIDKMEMGIDIKGYDINVLRLIKDYPEIIDELTFVRWGLRKNLLTID